MSPKPQRLTLPKTNITEKEMKRMHGDHIEVISKEWREEQEGPTRKEHDYYSMLILMIPSFVSTMPCKPILLGAVPLAPLLVLFSRGAPSLGRLWLRAAAEATGEATTGLPPWTLMLGLTALRLKLCMSKSSSRRRLPNGLRRAS